MARKKISEFTAKTILFNRLQLPYTGISVIGADSVFASHLNPHSLYVVKVDEGIKGRMKKGLVKLNIPVSKIKETMSLFISQGYQRFLIEEFIPHESVQERFFSLERTREGIKIYYSLKGGIDVEQNMDSVSSAILTDERSHTIAHYLGISQGVLAGIGKTFDDLYLSFLEVNPLVVTQSLIHFLDLAVEVDSSAEFFVKKGWTPADYVSDNLLGEKTIQEKNILDLKAKSQAAFTFDMLNPHGSIWMLLSGGGASIVLADEAYNLGRGKDVANYGEYSGNPNQEETYIYAKNLLSLLIQSTAPKKTLIIGGGVANFTDIRSTFKGVVRALDEVKDILHQQGVKVFVRRGGPNQKTGLSSMKEFLEKSQILGGVWDPSLILSDVISKAIAYIDH